MEQEVNELTINGVKYVKESALQSTAPRVDGLEAVIIRSQNAGVFYGYLESRKGDEVVLRQSRRVWYWSGAASLSQLAVDGTSKPKDCKFPVAVDRHTILQVIEVLPLTAKAKKSLDGVAVWQQ